VSLRYADYRDCRHIKESIKCLQSLADQLALEVPSEAARIFVQSSSTNNAEKSVSHLPIAAPSWCRLPSDVVQKPPPFREAALPETFLLDSSSRCSCGNTEIAIDDGLDDDGLDDDQLPRIYAGPFVVYNISGAIRLEIETAYCNDCPNTNGRIGPDLGEYGIFNWNNKVGFCHDLMNDYTKMFTSSETPFHPYHQTIAARYEDVGISENMGFCHLGIFEKAYFAFTALQEIGSDMRCSLCGPDPQVVIADGVSISFSSHRVESLRPPTIDHREQAWIRLRKTATRSTCFTGSVQLRKATYNALDLPESKERVEKLSEQTARIMVISVLPLLIL
jgi:hypothetical protein